MKKVAVFPGSFDPVTLGHYDIVERASPLFDKIIIAIGTNSQKKYMFPLEKRIEFIKNSFKHIRNVTIDNYEGLTVDYCLKNNLHFILRGLRNPADFEFEKAVAHTNRTISGGSIETIFLLTSSGKSFISSSIVREIMNNGGNYKLLVPDGVRI